MKVTQTLYSVYDKLSKHHIFFFTANSDTLAVRTALTSIRVPIRDTEIYKHAIVDEKDVKFLKKTTLVPWSLYKLPEDVAEALSPLECRSLIEQIAEKAETNDSNLIKKGVI